VPDQREYGRLRIKPGGYRTFSDEKGVNANNHLAADFIVRREISTAFRRLLFMCYILNMHAVTQNTSDEFNGPAWLSRESLDFHPTYCNCLSYRDLATVGRVARSPGSAGFEGRQMGGK
jgi:hypothetical protein